VWAEPLLDPLLDAVALGEAHGPRARRETVVHEVHGVLGARREGKPSEGGRGEGRGTQKYEREATNIGLKNKKTHFKKSSPEELMRAPSLKTLGATPVPLLRPHVFIM